MFRIFSALGRLFRSIGFAFTGKIDGVRAGVDSSPAVMQAKYEEIITAKGQSIKQFIDAISRLATQRQVTVRNLKTESDAVVDLERQKTGALKMAQKIASQYGSSEEAIKQNAKDWLEYNKCKNFYRDFSSTAEQKKTRIADLTARIKEYDETVAQHMTTLTSLKRDLEKLKVEAADSVARIISAKEERALNDTLNNLPGTDSHNKDLAEMRNMVANAEAGAKVSGQLAGTDTAHSIAQFEAAASEAIANDEFANLVGIKPIAPPLALPDKSASVLDSSSVYVGNENKVEVRR